MNGFSDVKKVLLICGNQTVSDIIQFDLSREGYRVLQATSFEAGEAVARRHRIDVVIVDIERDVNEVHSCCETIRKNEVPIPFILLGGAQGGMPEFIAQTGYIEALMKPFKMSDLKLKLLELIQRTSGFLLSDVQMPDGCEVTISTEDYQVYKCGEPISLSQTEYELFIFLAGHPGKVYSRKALMELVWNYESTGNDLRMVDVAIRRLRAKIEDDPAHPCLILTKRGAGYFFIGSRPRE